MEQILIFGFRVFAQYEKMFNKYVNRARQEFWDKRWGRQVSEQSRSKHTSWMLVYNV
jgi:hypothetical protein